MVNWLKRNKKELLFVIISTLIFCVPLFYERIYLGDDLLFHLNRIVGIKDAFIDGQILPKIYPYTNNGYGYASPLFYCDLFLYPFAILHYFGIPFIYCYKLMVMFYAFIGNVICLYVSKKVFKEKSIYYTVSFIYIFGHYRLLDCYSRAAFGEYLALSFVPLVLFAFYKVLIKQSDSSVLLAVSFTLLLMSHNITFALYCLLFAIFCLIFIFHNKRDKNIIFKQFIVVVKAIVLAVLLSLWYIAPMLEQFVSQEFWVNEYGDIYQISSNLIKFNDLLKPLLTIVFDKSINTISSLNCLGYLVLFVPIILLIFKKSFEWIDTLSICAYIFLLCAIGIIPIYKISLLNVIQFSFRWYILVYPLLTISTGYYIGMLDRKIINIFTVFYVCINLLSYNYYLINSSNSINNNENYNELYDFSDIYYKDYNEKQISGAEYLPITMYNDYLEETTFIKRINNDGQYEDVVYDYNRYFSNIDFIYESSGNELLMMPLTYYKGYNAYAIKDGIRYDLDVINTDTYHKVGFIIMDGIVEYHVSYNGTLIQHISLCVSVITTLITVVYDIKKWRKKYEKENIVCK